MFRRFSESVPVTKKPESPRVGSLQKERLLVKKDSLYGSRTMFIPST